MFEQMGFKVDRESSIYKRFRLKVLGAYFSLKQFVAVFIIYCSYLCFLISMISGIIIHDSHNQIKYEML